MRPNPVELETRELGKVGEERKFLAKVSAFQSLLVQISKNWEIH